MPKTRLGKWSVGLIAAFFLLLTYFYLAVASGQRGGETYFSNLWLAVPMTIAGISGIAAFFTGLVSIIRNKERSISVFLATMIGFLILLWALAEIIFPH